MTRTITVPKPAIVGLVLGELVSAGFAWRDLSRRTDDQVRGPKTSWRVFITLNPGNSLAYWAFARR